MHCYCQKSIKGTSRTTDQSEDYRGTLCHIVLDDLGTVFSSKIDKKRQSRVVPFAYSQHPSWVIGVFHIRGNHRLIYRFVCYSLYIRHTVAPNSLWEHNTFAHNYYYSGRHRRPENHPSPRSMTTIHHDDFRPVRVNCWDRIV